MAHPFTTIAHSTYVEVVGVMEGAGERQGADRLRPRRNNDGGDDDDGGGDGDDDDDGPA